VQPAEFMCQFGNVAYLYPVGSSARASRALRRGECSDSRM